MTTPTDWDSVRQAIEALIRLAAGGQDVRLRLTVGGRRYRLDVVAEMGQPGGAPTRSLITRRRAKFSQSCLDDILWAMDLAGRRLHGPEIAAELARRGRPWNGTSLAHTLAEAKERGILDHERRTGYGIAQAAAKDLAPNYQHTEGD